MPLPVSAQSYLPNPLLGNQAHQQGLSYGQGAVQGFLNAAQSTFNIAQTAQEISMAPEKLDLERRRVETGENAQTDSERRTDIMDIAEERQSREQDWREVYQGESLDMQWEQNTIRREEIASAERRARIHAAGRSSASAEKSHFEGVASSYLLDGDIDSLYGEMGDISTPEGRHRRSKFVTTAGRSKQFAEALVNKAEDDLASGRVVEPEQRQILQDMSRQVSLFANVQNTAEKAEKSRQFLEGDLGFAPLTRGRRYTPEKDPSGGYHVWELDPATKKRSIVGHFQEDDPTKPNGNRSKMFNALSTINRLFEIEKETSKAIQADAARKRATEQGGTEGALPPQQDRPARAAPQGTESTRLGLDRAPLSSRTEKSAVTETQRLLQKKEARRRALQAMGRDTPEPADGSEMRGGFSSAKVGLVE